MNTAAGIAKQMDGVILCPVCLTEGIEQPLSCWALDHCPDGDTLFCPHCDLQVHVEVHQ